MAGDIFGYKRSPKPQGVFSSEGSKMNMSKGNAKGYLVQNWTTNYSQDVQEVFEIGSDSLYWVKGRPVGAGSIGRLVGEKSDTSNTSFFPDEAYDACDGGVEVTLSVKGGHCDKAPSTGVKLDKGVKIKMDGVLVTSIGFSMNVAQNVQLHESFGWRFAWMQLETF